MLIYFSCESCYGQQLNTLHNEEIEAEKEILFKDVETQSINDMNSDVEPSSLNPLRVSSVVRVSVDVTAEIKAKDKNKYRLK